MGQTCSCFQQSDFSSSVAIQSPTSDDCLKRPLASSRRSSEDDSDLQSAIALSMRLSRTSSTSGSIIGNNNLGNEIHNDIYSEGKKEIELECVMCLDTFDKLNPKVRTLCDCGMNRTNFHLSCLYQWIERDQNCPVCRKMLYFEED